MQQTFTGRLTQSAFGGGWNLELPDGQRMTLAGEVTGGVREGDRVRVIGEVRGDMMSIDMVGPVLEVRSVTKL